MYTLTNIDFSNWSGVVVSEVPSDEIDREDQTLDAKQGGALSDASFGQRRPSTVSACWGPSTAQPAPPRRRVGRFDHRERARLDWTPRYGGRDVETSGKSLGTSPALSVWLSCCDAKLLEDDPALPLQWPAPTRSFFARIANFSCDCCQIALAPTEGIPETNWG